MAIIIDSKSKEQILRVVNDDHAIQTLPETSADQVILEDAGDKFTSENVEGALAEVAQDIADLKTGLESAGKVDDVQDVNGASIVTNKIAKLSKAAVGLGNVDNTADANKSVKYAGEAGKVTNSFSVLGQDSTGIEKSVTFDGSADKEVSFNENDFTTTLTGNALEVSIADKGYALKTYVDTQDNKKLDKAGGTVTGDLAVNGAVTVGGNLTVNGTTTTVNSSTLQVTDKLIEVAHGNTAKLTTPAGLVAPKYDGTNSGALVFDGDGVAKVGDVVLDSNGNIDVAQSDLQPLATRTGLVDGNLVKYDGTNQTLVDSGKSVSDFALKTDLPTNYVTTNTKQDITGEKAFKNENGISTNRIHNLSGNAVYDYDGTNIRIGSVAKPIHIRGSEARPKYELPSGASSGETVKKDIALVEDIAVTTVNNAKNVTTSINGKAITSIFETDGVTAKNATHAGLADNATNARSADVVANKLKVSGQDALGRETQIEYDGAVAKEVAFNTTDFTGTEATNKYTVELATVYLDGAPAETVAGTYTAVSVNSKGVVQNGGRSIAFIGASENIPADVMIGGLVFRKKA